MESKTKQSQPVDWMPRIYVYACDNVDDAQRLAKKHQKCDFDDITTDAVTQTVRRGLDTVSVIVVNGFDGGAQDIAILAHECSHAVGNFLDVIGEGHNDSEFRAYLIQSCMLACLGQLGYGESDK